MDELKGKIGFIGAGNMADALAGAAIRAGLYRSENVYMSDISQERLNLMRKKYGIKTFNDNFKVFSECETIILAIKPQHMSEVLSQIAQHPEYAITDRKIVISIAAGIRIQKIENILYPPLNPDGRKKLPIIRVMPNTPALVMAGISGMSPNGNASQQDLDHTKAILNAIGKVVEVNESDLDAVTGVSGSGPAYVLYLIESMIEAGVKKGLSPEVASLLAIHTVKGTAVLVEKTGELPQDLRRKVTSPGGTTEAAFEVLEINNVKQSIIDAIGAAVRRARQLSQ